MVGILAPPTFLFAKNTFFIMYLDIFGPWRWLKICAYVGAIFTTLCYGAFTLLNLICATPRHGETLLSHEESNIERLIIVTGVPLAVFGLLVDLYIFVLPIIAVSRLQLPTRRRVGIILVFMTGLLQVLVHLLQAIVC